MLMIEYVSWLATGLVMTQFWLFVEQHYVAGWWTGIVAATAWSIYAVETQQWAVLSLQVFLFGIAVHALKKLNKPEETSGLPRRSVVESKNHRKDASKQSHIGDGHDPITGEITDDLL